MEPIYRITGVVQNGAKRGKAMGFPTANVFLIKKIPEGIYASQVIVRDKIYQAATFIGAAKTFGEKEHKAESYILDFDSDIYGEHVTIHLFKKLRENEKFISENVLVEQMKKDVLDTREFFRGFSR